MQCVTNCVSGIPRPPKKEWNAICLSRLGETKKKVRAGTLIPALKMERLENELQGEFHRPGVGLDVGDPPERAAGLLNQVYCPVGARRQTVTRVGESQVLMVQGVEHFPAEVKVLAFGNVKLLSQ